MAQGSGQDLESLLSRPGLAILVRDLTAFAAHCSQSQSLSSIRSRHGEQSIELDDLSSALRSLAMTYGQSENWHSGSWSVLPRVIDYIEACNRFDVRAGPPSESYGNTGQMTVSFSSRGTEDFRNPAPSPGFRTSGSISSFRPRAPSYGTASQDRAAIYPRPWGTHQNPAQNYTFAPTASSPSYITYRGSYHTGGNGMIRPISQEVPRSSQAYAHFDSAQGSTQNHPQNLQQTTAEPQFRAIGPTQAPMAPQLSSNTRQSLVANARSGPDLRIADTSASLEQADNPRATRALFDTFKQPSKPKKFFRVGRVFMVLWTEPLGDERLSESSHFTLPGLYGDWLYQKVRRFIVIAEAEQHCTAIPILSYGNKGVAKKGLNKADHGIVYVGSIVPEPEKDELPARGEDAMVKVPVRVDPDNRTEKLGHKSRINYNKVYTIEHNVRARSVGMITKSLPDLLSQTTLVWSRATNGLGNLGVVPGVTLQSTDAVEMPSKFEEPTETADYQSHSTVHLSNLNTEADLLSTTNIAPMPTARLD